MMQSLVVALGCVLCLLSSRSTASLLSSKNATELSFANKIGDKFGQSVVASAERYAVGTVANGPGPLQSPHVMLYDSDGSLKSVLAKLSDSSVSYTSP
jgi:hypothetical protein